ncbi:MAG: type II secretion system protein GspN [Myxococcota bacterium]|jgi:type II secretion system protein N|nr:type II secretion system protein GspN [Myxococcota bacterium]
MKAILLKLLLFPLLGLVALVVFIFLTLPEDKLQLLVERNVEKALDHEYRVEMDGFDFSLLSGVRLERVMLSPRFTASEDDKLGTKPLPDDPEAPENQYFCPASVDPVPMIIDSLWVDPSWFALLGGKFDGSFGLEAAGGSIAGSLGSSDGEDLLEASIESVALQRFTLLRNKLGMHLVGQLNGAAELSFGESMSLSGGFLSIDMRNVVLCPKRVAMTNPNVPFFDLPLTRMGNIKGRVEVKQRRLEFKDFQGEGEDMALQVQGSIQLPTPNIPKTRYDLRINLRPSEQWLQDNDMGILFTICRRFEDGSLQIVVSGEAGALKRDCIKATNTNTPAPRPAAAPSARLSPAPSVEPELTPPAPKLVEEQPPVPSGIERKTRAPIGPTKRTYDRDLTRPSNAAELRGKIDPVPDERRKKVLGVYNR